MWRYTQEPAIHQQWDLRFTDIEYLPKESEEDPQRFLYATRIGFGKRIEGGGESIGTDDSETSRTSSLRFWSEDWKSLIQSGSGYWKYEVQEGGVRFLTRYGYDARFGALGRWFDRLVFRPLIGWATAWSFDCLRLWIEREVRPTDAIRRSLAHGVCRVVLAFIWLYQGIVPKLMYGALSGELETIRRSGVFEGREEAVLIVVGIVEIVLGLMTLGLYHSRWVFPVTISLLVGLGVAGGVTEPELLWGQFNLVTLNISMVGLALIGWTVSHDLPNAGRCLRVEPR